MKIALINENSQAAKNEVICNALKKVVEPMGHEVFNYGMYTLCTGWYPGSSTFEFRSCGLCDHRMRNRRGSHAGM